MTSTATKYANKSFLSQLGGFFPCSSLWVEGWLWVGWVVSFAGFDCCFLFVVGGLRMNLGALFSPLSSHLSKPTHNLYVDLVALSSTRLKSSSIIFSLKIVFKAHSQISNLLLKLGVLFDSMEKLTLERGTCFTWRG
jgi:hypothetical protein